MTDEELEAARNLRPGEPSPYLDSLDPRWKATAIALTDAGASSCGEFYVTEGGVAHCADSRQSWAIDFEAKTATLME